MKEFIGKYGGWILTGILATVIIYILFFKPISGNDNTALINQIDSISKINKQLNERLTSFGYQYAIDVTALEEQNKTLLTQNDFLKLKNETAYESNYSLAKQVQYYKAKEDEKSYDSACDLLAKQVIQDSVVLRDYVINTDKLVQDLNDHIGLADSLITYQSNLIVSDSLLINAQKKLNDTQQGQLVKSGKQLKMVTWVARGLAVTAGVLFIMFESK